jgi:hypothetical protein
MARGHSRGLSLLLRLTGWGCHPSRKSTRALEETEVCVCLILEATVLSAGDFSSGLQSGTCQTLPITSHVTLGK